MKATEDTTTLYKVKVFSTNHTIYYLRVVRFCKAMLTLRDCVCITLRLVLRLLVFQEVRWKPEVNLLCIDTNREMSITSMSSRGTKLALPEN